MKINEIRIDRFGVWRDLTLTLPNSGLNIFYGPNEAGKSTLLRFLRGVLYGFSGRRSVHGPGPSRKTPWEGALRVEHNGKHCEIRRASHHEPQGLVRVTGWEQESSVDEVLSELLCETGEDLFETIFAIGLHELQELATLEGEEVAQRIYGLSLGVKGNTLLDAGLQAEEEQRELLDWESQGGRLAGLWSRYEELNARIAEEKETHREYRELRQQREGLNERIEDLKQRQSGLQSQLRGHEFLRRVWNPWNLVRELQQELDSLPVVSGFPEDGLSRLGEIDDELTTAKKCHQTLLTEAKELRRQAQQLELDPEIRKHSATIQSFVDQRQWISELKAGLDEAETQTQTLKDDLDHQIHELGSEWSLERLEKVDTSPAAHYRMVSMARTYQNALTRRAKLRKRIQKLSHVSQKHMNDLNEGLKSFGTESVEEALGATKEKLEDLENLGRLRLQETELQQRLVGIHEQIGRLEEAPTLPKWVYIVLGFFGVTGIILAVLGIVTGVTTSGIGGMAYALLGSTCGGLAWALKKHFETEVHECMERLRDGISQTEVRLRETRQGIEKFTAPEQAGRRMQNNSRREDLKNGAASNAELIKQASHQLAELERLERLEKRIQRMRRRLTQLRSRFQSIQREVSTSRQNWCELLTQLGFSETVRVDEAFQNWQRVVEANEQRRLWQEAQTELHRQRQSWQTYRQRIEELGHRMDYWDLDYDDPLDILANWEEQLRNFAENRAEQRRLYREEKTRRQEAVEYRRRIEELKNRRGALLVQGGATTREEFEQRADWITQRQEVEELLEEAQSDLAEARQSEPHLAIVEEDLLAYNPEENEECIQTIQKELDDLELDLQQAFEDRGSVKQKIHSLESDRRPTQLRFEREQVRTELKREAEQWFALQIAAQAVRRMQSRFERTCQPETLAAASGFLEKLTCGKYREIRTPLGKRHLLVEDDHGQALRVEQLSNGTREQLFLAIRLAMIEEFSQQGVELPMILDDVLVNFDQPRTEAAVETLIDFANQGQQILLMTCHLHLAHLFESKNVPPVWLPGHNLPLEDRRAG